MSPTSKKIVGGVIALLFIVTIVQSAAIAKVAKGLRSNAQNVATLSNTESQRAAVSKTESAAKRADSTNGVYADALKGDKVTNKEITILCTPAGCDNGITLPYAFQFDDQVNITYCGGGGGGGGGGRGEDSTIVDDAFGSGGGGGGGGAAGQCIVHNQISVTSGQIISASIGGGGPGGVGAFKSLRYATNDNLLSSVSANPLFFLEEDFQYNSPEVYSASGAMGQPTNINLTGVGGNYFSWASGGSAGLAGTSATASNGLGVGSGGEGANFILPGWHDGTNGTYGGSPYGGQGGDGESLAGSISGNTASAGGGGGTNDTLTDISHKGVNGTLSSGGGGGSGGFGGYYNQFGCGNGPTYEQGEPVPFLLLPAPTDLYNSLCRILKGGFGGNGGDGYLIIEGVQIPPATQMVFENPGTHTFGWTMVPAGATVTVKVWGAGGGGGRAFENSFTTLEDIMGAGGGSGAYVVHQMINPGSGSMPVVVGSGGQNGVAGGPNAGSAGGQSSFGTIIATGGNGGSGDTEGNQNANVYGGSGGIAAGGSVSNTNGVTGASGVAGGLGGDQAGLVGFADGGKGGIINNQGGANLVNRNSEAGKPGRVEITW